MKKIDLGQAITILANVGVIAGIVFLGLELRQTQRSIEASAYQDVISKIADYAALTLSDRELNYLLGVKALESPPAITSDEEWEQVNTHFFLTTRLADLVYFQYLDGIISQERMESTISPLRGRWCSDAYLDFWERNASSFVAQFRGFVTSRIESEC